MKNRIMYVILVEVIKHFVANGPTNEETCILSVVLTYTKQSVRYINLFIETVTTQRFNEITFVSSSSSLLHVSAFHKAIIR
jgi:hypothetical protein